MSLLDPYTERGYYKGLYRWGIGDEAIKNRERET